MSLPDYIWEELEEESEQKQTYVHAVHIGIGSHNNLVISQALKAILDVQRRLQQVELLVLIYHGAAKAKAVERFTAQAEHSLRVGIAALGN